MTAKLEKPSVTTSKLNAVSLKNKQPTWSGKPRIHSTKSKVRERKR